MSRSHRAPSGPGLLLLAAVLAVLALHNPLQAFVASPSSHPGTQRSVAQLRDEEAGGRVGNWAAPAAAAMGFAPTGALARDPWPDTWGDYLVILVVLLSFAVVVAFFFVDRDVKARKRKEGFDIF
eukprot:CAMPEP_0117556166 /NCGR_PEP_ID=MMETSP0784-20121206/51661_1 /TAXON_ID=39447 /ORGANISM="" /LENGTH=124 /DNA_ID=CAMNT_0005353417 /DNA_START=75 /DNA_END=449 /DNA_ORIENTATION=+